MAKWIANDTIYDEWGLLVQNEKRLLGELGSLRYRMTKYYYNTKLMDWYTKRIDMIQGELRDRGVL